MIKKRWSLFTVLVLGVLGAAGATSAAELPAKALDALRAARDSRPVQLALDGVPLKGGEKVSLDLQRVEVFSSSFRLSINGVLQPAGVGKPETVYYSGSVRGQADSIAVIAVGDTVRGYLQTSNGPHLVGPRGNAYQAKGDAPVHVLDVAELPDSEVGFRCGTDSLPFQGFKSAGAGAAASAPSAPTWNGVKNVDVAIETDFELFQAFGSVSGLLNYVGDMTAAGSAIYLRDIQTTLQVPYVSVWTTAADPWTTTNDSSVGLAELGNYWHEPANGRTTIVRTTVHMLSKKPTQGGVAWTGVLCAEDFPDPTNPANWGGAYGFSGALHAQFSTVDSAFYWDLVEYIHELGHNFKSRHTHCYDPPIDQCYNQQNGCYAGATSLPPGGGTIMSYCHGLPGGMANINLVFGSPGQPSDAVRQVMRQHVEDVTCSCVVPQAPSALEPANGATAVTTGYLRWGFNGNSGSWNPSGVTAYDVYFDTVNPPEKRISTTSVEPSMAMPTWFPNTVYYWKVVAKNGCGNTSSPVYSFTTGAACSFAGAAPVLTAPVNEETGVGRRVRLTWNPVPGAAHYTVLIGTTNPPTGAIRTLYAPQTALEIGVAPGTTYFWRVRATPGCGNGSAALSAASSFTTAGSTPALTSITPTVVNRWAGTTTLFGAGNGLSNETLVFVDLAGRRAGTFTLGGVTATSISGGLAVDPATPSGFYDAGLTYYGIENQRIPRSITIKAFTDVPENDFYFLSTSRVVDAGIMEADFDAVTPGPQFSPASQVTREFMAEYLAKGYQWWRTGSTTVPAATCVPSGDGSTDFPDVPCSHPRWLYIHWLKTWGVTVGSPCPGGQGNCYLPNNSVDRSQMVTFLLRLKYGATLPAISAAFGTRDPGCAAAWPTCVGWSDPGLQIPVTTWPHAEVNVAYSDRLTTGCAAGNPPTFCAFDAVSRGQMVEFLARIVNLVPNP